ncbi:hypothetical protein [Pseudomonas sp. JV245A]|uniref:hypothetical protein n=1 Tax=Pseudomonas sp. JV245A TaxID=1890668 RepID=UPI0028E0EF95|nr:hypothetical protein [Pseudomonas sp. JV245A]MDT9643588.1 hypothetical protein [Pseudomonas sp. JV245A]
MPTETQHLEQRVAALQSDLNTRDEQIDALTLSDNDRELSRRSWFDEAKRLEKEVEELRAEVKRLDLMGAQSDYNYDQRRAQFDRVLAERDALLERCRLAVVNGEDFDLPASLLDEIKALSASAEPSDECAHSYANNVGCPECGEAFDGGKPNAPKCKYCGDTGQFMVGSSGDASDGNAPIMARCEDCELGEPNAPIELKALRAFVGAAYPVASEINKRGYNWCEAYLDDALALARAALDKATEGALKPAEGGGNEPNCLLCLDKKTVPSNLAKGYVMDCPDCCGEEG